MAYKLCNPTPFEARIDYEPGRPIVIPADSEVELTHEQGHEFRLDNPGTETVLEVTRPQGVFLRDDSRNYDVQAMEALRGSARLKKAEYARRVDSLKKLKSEQGTMPDEASMEQMINDHGLGKLLRDAEVCDRRAKAIAEATKDLQETVRDSFDPDRTCFVLDTGPKEFPSRLALQLFLEENPEIAAKHREYMGSE